MIKDYVKKAKNIAKIPELIISGKKLIYPARQSKWNKLVIELGGQGFDESLEIMKMLDSGEDFEDILKKMQELCEQKGPNAWSAYSEIIRDVLNFSKKGTEFCRWLNDSEEGKKLRNDELVPPHTMINNVEDRIYAEVNDEANNRSKALSIKNRLVEFLGGDIEITK